MLRTGLPKFPFSIVFLLILITFIASTGQTQSITRGEVGTVANTDYNGDCEANDLDFTDTMLSYWNNEMEANLFTTNFISPNINHLWMTDIDKVDWGRDHWSLKMDTYDIVMISGHGGTYSHNGIPASFLYLGHKNDIDNCMVRPRTEMQIGDNDNGDLEILHLYFCQSMTTDDDRYRATWNPTFSGVHQIHGFHGNAWEAFVMIYGMQTLAEEGQDNPVAEEWLQNMYHPDMNNHEQCPVAYTGRTTSAAATSILLGETYRNRENWVDMPDPTVFKRMYYDGCNPEGAGVQ